MNNPLKPSGTDYKTRDLFLAAAIWSGGHDVEMTIENGTAYFGFEPTAIVQEIVVRFKRGTLECNAKNYARAYIRLKDMMMDRLNGRQ